MTIVDVSNIFLFGVFIGWLLFVFIHEVIHK